ncbi:hypothetical protein H6F93_08400 [Leptolyngbya sp. FACHB-671]|uniref:hypothetical protein n=1 Tax=Leptolyngbya sp. FACHB-671 TaxID=2692812 RepID=UPI0016887622|nr:hypothetical protein [Leptolyngbya sp. FACHB-671]MBD2067552.1 hypothetical protein [Leptolyngbya sp. FACHB-671]
MTPDQSKRPKPNQQKFWQQIQPVLKTQSLRALRTTIQVLEGIVEELEKTPAPTQAKLSPPTKQSASGIKAAPVETLEFPAAPTMPAAELIAKPDEIASTPPEVKSLEDDDDNIWGMDESLSLDEQSTLGKPTEAIAPPTPTPSATPLTSRANTPLPASQGSLWAKWVAVLDWARDRLPDSISDRLSDAVLTSIAGGVLVLLVWTTSALLPNQAEEIAQAPPVQSSPVVKPTPSPQLKPTPSPQLKPTPSPQLKPTPSPQPSPPKQVAPAPTPIVVPPTPKPTPSPSPVVSPPPAPPPLELTPEQSLIAAIQDQVAEVTNRYANGFIQSIQANFRESRLIVKVSMGWYELSGDRQNKLADEMLKRAQELDFSKLEITDTQGILLARSPVVGPSMIILQREMKTKLPA